MIISSFLILLLTLFFPLTTCFNPLAQVPFLTPFTPDSSSNNTSTRGTTTTLKLKTIYHHASINGPIPHLFRRLDISSSSQLVNTQQHVTYPMRSKLAVHDRPVASDLQQLLTLRKTEAAADPYSLTRWNHVMEQQGGDMRVMHLESVVGLVPDVTDRPSVLSLAMMTNNAYLDIDLNNTDWYDLGEPWNLNHSFGWEKDGLRGHVFTNDDDSLVVVSIKGTSAGLWTGGPTSEKDKLNDNMLFSCCCARISRAWTPVCDCFQGNEYQCENSCLQNNIGKSELYYDNAMAIVTELIDRYPDSTVWITGHSLGGAVASMVGQTFGVPTVTFEIPGDRMASQRLHLPIGPGAKNPPIWHFGHTADPIYVGVCTGPSSSCWYGGFAMESRCHTGNVCVWDTVKDNGWRVDIRTHRVRDVIEQILKLPEQFPLPECVQEQECQDCGLWEYFDKRDGPFTPTNTKHSTMPPITSSSSSSSSENTQNYNAEPTKL